MIRKIRRSGPSIDLSKGGKSQRNWGAVSIGRGGGRGGRERWSITRILFYQLSRQCKLTAVMSF